MRETQAADEHVLLSVPSRARILDLVRGAADAVTAAQLADEVGMHVTTVRFHLDQLERAGLVRKAPEPSRGRGRPRIGYRAGALDLGQVREQMIDALAEALVDRSSLDRSLTAGRRWADRLPEPQGEPAAAVTEVFAQLGFAPDSDGTTIDLHRCPFGEAARRTPEVVCRVHLGLAQGLAGRAARARGVTIPDVALVPFATPDRCELTIGVTKTRGRSA